MSLQVREQRGPIVAGDQGSHRGHQCSKTSLPGEHGSIVSVCASPGQESLSHLNWEASGWPTGPVRLRIGVKLQGLHKKIETKHFLKWFPISLRLSLDYHKRIEILLVMLMCQIYRFPPSPWFFQSISKIFKKFAKTISTSLVSLVRGYGQPLETCGKELALHYAKYKSFLIN